MEITRRRFGIALLAGMASLLLARLGALLSLCRRFAAQPARAMFWTRGDRLAG
ncbi:MAG: hypothetical protein JXA24_05510 [Proteobacteria bacterium]|nr:hypothetical protein [Pseudomonadota bacterium]